MFKTTYIAFCFVVLTTGCIKDDFIDDTVQPVIRISNVLDSLALDTTYQFMADYFNNVGIQTATDFDWSTSDPSVISINSSTGLAQPMSFGPTTISVGIAGNSSGPMDSFVVSVGENTVEPGPAIRSGTLETTSTYLLTGSFILTEEGAGCVLEFEADYEASTSLPGLNVYLTNNPNTTAGAYEIGAVTVFSGAHSYALPDVGVFDYSHILYYCAPFNIKVGDGQIN